VGLLFLLVSSTFFAVSVQAQSTGLSKGQWAHYSIAGDLSEGVIASNFTINSVDASTLTFQRLDTYSDGTRQVETQSLDLVTGDGTGPPGLYFAIYPGKTTGSPVYQDPTFNISKILQGTYAQASRQLDYAVASNSTDKIEYYWDFETGISTLIKHTSISTGRSLVYAAMTETNVWKGQTNQTPPDQPNLNINLYAAGATILSGFLILVVLAGRFTKRRGKK